MCHDDPFKDEQCMKKETLGTNTFYWVRKCKGAKVCVELPYYSGIIGACSIKVRSHYDGEACANGNKCTSGICDGTKCKGLNPGIKCEVGLGQCQKGYLCMATSSSSRSYKCQKPLSKDDDCTGRVPLGSSSSNSLYDGDPDLFNPAYNPCKLGLVCATTGTSTSPKCIEIGSVNDNTRVSNPLACKTGFVKLVQEDYDRNSEEYRTKYYSCATPSDDMTGTNLESYTSKGAAFTKFANITTAFNAWLNEWKKKDLKDEDANYEAYRYTKNKKKINEAFYKYVYAPFVQDADECAYDYMWKQNSSNSLKFSLMILVLALLF